ncbi:MAG: polysaccharide pyruvyl transferase family protein [Chlamydiota bacterium]
MKKICVLGNFSGRNAGDAAILGGLLEDVSSRYPDTLFTVPTISTGFVRRAFSRYRVKPVSLMPWNLSLKILGLPVFTSTLGADLILVTDAILFERRLYDPTHNYLSTLAFVLPFARRRGVPLVLYNMSLGPVKTPRGEWLLTRVLRSADLVITRDADSHDLARRLGPFDEKLRLGADCALNVVPSGDGRLGEIMRREGILSGPRPTVGFNINRYIDADIVPPGGKGIDRGLFLGAVKAAVDRAVDEFGVDILLVVTQPMDMEITGELMRSLARPERVRIISNRDYSHNDLAKVLSRLEMLIALRTHTLILASAGGTPVGCVVSYPKNRGYMRSIDMGDQLLEFGDFSAETYWGLVERTWRRRAGLRERLAPAIAREKEKARRSAELLAPFLA